MGDCKGNGNALITWYIAGVSGSLFILICNVEFEFNCFMLLSVTVKQLVFELLITVFSLYLLYIYIFMLLNTIVKQLAFEQLVNVFPLYLP